MHYPRRLSKVSRNRRQGFRARMQSPTGRRVLSRQRRKGRYQVGIKTK